MKKIAMFAIAVFLTCGMYSVVNAQWMYSGRYWQNHPKSAEFFRRTQLSNKQQVYDLQEKNKQLSRRLCTTTDSVSQISAKLTKIQSEIQDKLISLTTAMKCQAMQIEKMQAVPIDAVLCYIPATASYVVVEKFPYLSLFWDQDEITIMQIRDITKCPDGSTTEQIRQPAYTLADRIFAFQTRDEFKEIVSCDGKVKTVYWRAKIEKRYMPTTFPEEGPIPVNK